MRWILLLGLGILVYAAGTMCAQPRGVSQGTLWMIPWNHDGVVRVQAGDVVEIWTKPLPIIPENLEARFRASKDGRGIEFLGETLPHKEGTMERLYFFKAFDPGTATAKIDLVGREGNVMETFAYEIEVLAAER